VARENTSNWLTYIVLGWLVFYGGSPLLGDIWYSKLALALRYTNTMNEVTTAGPRPHDCDWFRSPIGDKGCSYHRELSFVTVKPNRWGGQSVSYDEEKTWTEYAKNNDGYAIYSSDGGTTWSIDSTYTGPIKPSVTVMWQKKNED
jgi:hypothetical protein